MTLAFGNIAHDNNGAALLLCVGDIYSTAFVKYELQAGGDGLAVDSFDTVLKLPVHSRVSLFLRLVPRVCIHWSGTQTQKQVRNGFYTVYCEPF